MTIRQDKWAGEEEGKPRRTASTGLHGQLMLMWSAEASAGIRLEGELSSFLVGTAMQRLRVRKCLRHLAFQMDKRADTC